MQNLVLHIMLARSINDLSLQYILYRFLSDVVVVDVEFDIVVVIVVIVVVVVVVIIIAAAQQLGEEVCWKVAI